MQERSERRLELLTISRKGSAQMQTPALAGFLAYCAYSSLSCTTLYDVRASLEENEGEFTDMIANIRKILAADDAVKLAA